jgi:SulP family sulfate permease
VLLLGPLAAYIPKSVLAGLLIVASTRLIDIKRICYTATASLPDALLLGATALAAIFIGVEYAILIGSAASIIWYLLHASRLKTQELVVSPEQVVRARIGSDPPSRDIAIYDFEGEFFFGAALEIHAFLQKAKNKALANGTKALVLRLKRVRNPDAVALEVLDVFLREAHKEGLTVFLAGLRPELQTALERMGVARLLGEEFIFPEEEKDYSAMLGAIRAAYARIRNGRSDKSQAPAYYLV